MCRHIYDCNIVDCDVKQPQFSSPLIKQLTTEVNPADIFYYIKYKICTNQTVDEPILSTYRTNTSKLSNFMSHIKNYVQTMYTWIQM